MGNLPNGTVVASKSNLVRRGAVDRGRVTGHRAIPAGTEVADGDELSKESRHPRWRLQDAGQDRQRSDRRQVRYPGVLAAGEVVPALAVLDAAFKTATVEMGHSASYYYVGKEPALAFDICPLFGLNARQQNAWIEPWRRRRPGPRRVFSTYGIRRFSAGNTGAQMAGWFSRKEIEQSRGFGLEPEPAAWRDRCWLLGVGCSIGAADVYPALERGTIDAAEW